MRIYKKKVKKHEEVWADVPDYGEGRVKVCIGNSNYARLYVASYYEGEGWGVFLSDEETAEAMKLFKEIWADNTDNNPFTD